MKRPGTCCSRRHSFTCCTWRVLLVSVLAGWPCSPGLGATIPPEKAIAVIESLEKKITAVRWKVHSQNGKLLDANDTNAITDYEPCFCEAEVVFDPVGKRYNMKRRCLSEWINGTADYRAGVDGYSFDGEEYRGWDRSRPGMDFPEATASAWGAIAKDTKDIPIAAEALTSGAALNGISFMPPYINPMFGTRTEPLSRMMRQWLDEKIAVVVEDNADGTWTINAPGATAEVPNYLLRIRYDLAKGGIVSDIKQLAKLKNGKEVEGAHLLYELQKVDERFWMPKTVKWIGGRGAPPYPIAVFTFTDVEVNPPVDKNTFRLKFPDGVRVTDRIKKWEYITGKVVNEPEAVRNYMTVHNLTGDVPPPAKSRQLICLICSVVLLLACTTALIVRRRRKAAQ